MVNDQDFATIDYLDVAISCLLLKLSLATLLISPLDFEHILQKFT